MAAAMGRTFADVAATALAEQLADIRARYERHDDYEAAHSEADHVVMQFLRQIGQHQAAEDFGHVARYTA